jgi:hypothetical protein
MTEAHSSQAAPPCQAQSELHEHRLNFTNYERRDYRSPVVSPAFQRFVDEAFDQVGGRDSHGANTKLAEALGLSVNYVSKLKSYEGGLRAAACFTLAAFIGRDPLDVLRAADHADLADALTAYLRPHGQQSPQPTGPARAWLDLFRHLTQEQRRILTDTANAFTGQRIEHPGPRRVRDAVSKRKKVLP